MQFIDIDSILNYYNEQLNIFENIKSTFSDEQKKKWTKLEAQLNELYDSGVIS